MATIHIPEAEAADKFASLMSSVRAGAEVVFEENFLPVAVLSPPTTPRRTIEECIALLPENSTGIMDEDFARDVQAAINAHREPLDPPVRD
jgi:antitoxin (DNA-binding transcriptional repressor) of toxin-antitoxin stability system